MDADVVMLKDFRELILIACHLVFILSAAINVLIFDQANQFDLLSLWCSRMQIS